MATIADIEHALIVADRSGNMDDARKLAAILQRERQRLADDPMGDLPESRMESVGRVEPDQGHSIGELATGAGEAVVSAATGATTGTVGMVGGFLKQLADEVRQGNFGSMEAADRIEQASMAGMEAGTYAPKTEAGRDILKTVGEATAPLTGAAPMMGEMGAISTATKAATVPARAATVPARAAAGKIKDAIKNAKLPEYKTGGGFGDDSAGSARVADAEVRQARANELPVPVRYTAGQASKDFESERFERETAKLAEQGAPIRDRYAEQELQLQRNVDSFIDMTGAELADRRAVGTMVDDVLNERYSKDKAKIRVLYKDAEKSGELESPVNLDSLVEYLNEKWPNEDNAPILNTAKKGLIRFGAVAKAPDDPNTVVKLKDLNINELEQIRQSITSGMNPIGPDLKFGGDLKRIIDRSTEGAGGKKYKQARAARAKLARDYEDVTIVKRLLNTKPNTDDRYISLEQVVDRAILAPDVSLDQMRHVRKLIQTKTGEKGKQAWREIQGAVLRNIQEKSLKSVVVGEKTDRLISPAALDKAITELEKSGKLPYLFDKKGAEMLDILREVAREVKTAPPGTVNSSNTATVLAGLADLFSSSMTGLPLPAATASKHIIGRIKDKNLQKRIDKALAGVDGG